MMEHTKISSILQLSKWKPGDKPFWVVREPIGAQDTIINAEDEWAFSGDVHPKTLYEYKLLKGVWPPKLKLPKLSAPDFAFVVDLLTTELVVEVFEVIGVTHCNHTGEFIYQNTNEEWQPESNLFSTAAAAKKERARIKQLISKWAAKIPTDLV